MKKLFCIILFILSSNTIFAQDITGQWNGVLNVMGTQLRLVFHIEQTDSGYTATFDSPDQEAEGISFSTVTYDEPELKLEAVNIGATYMGKVSPDSINGTWNQGGQAFPLSLFKNEVEKTEYHRPQEPSMPYPYHEEEVLIQNKKDELTLAGTLTIPNTNGIFPAVILISGSGPQNRNQDIFGHKPFLVIADHLTRHGIAVLRYDDRGTAESTGSFNTATTADFTTDVLSAVEFLKTIDEIDTNNIGLIGHSEGAIIAPLAVNQSEDIAFMVLLAGTGIPGKEILLIQSQTLRELRSFKIQDEKTYQRFNEKVVEIAASEKETDEKRKELIQYYKSVEPILQEMLPERTEINTFINQQVNASLSPWAQFFYTYNPSDELEKVTIPVLSLNGSKDVQVDAKINQSAIKEALEKARNKDFKIIEMEGLNHMFQESETGSISEYSTIEQTFSPLALNEITRWIKNHIKK